MTSFLHIMIRVENIKNSYNFYTNVLGFQEKYRKQSLDKKSILIFLMDGNKNECIELCYNNDSNNKYTVGRNIGHISIKVSNIYIFCEKLLSHGIELIRPPYDGN